MAKYCASEAATAINMMEVISDFFDPSCRDDEEQLDDVNDDFGISEPEERGLLHLRLK